MESVNTWLAAVAAVISVLAGMAAMLRWVVSTVDSRIDTRIVSHLGPMDDRLNARIDRLDARIDGLGTRMDTFDTKLDHLAEVMDLRLKPVEEDMALVKRHLLGSTAA